MKNFVSSKRSQIWIETVIYTLIGLTIIGIVLGIVKPAIDEKRDEISVSQSIEVLNAIESKIDEVKYVSGNSRHLDIKISRGKLIFDGKEDKIEMIIEKSKYVYSEPELNVSVGSILALTEKKGKDYTITLTLDYKNKLDITYKENDEIKILQPVPSPYDINLVNKGMKGNLTNIDFF